MRKPLREIVIVCDSCNSSFHPKSIAIKEEYVKLCGDRIRVIYYKCPKCKKLYLIGLHNYTSDKLLKRQKELIATTQKRVAKGLPADPKKLEQIEELKKQLLSYQNTLMERYKDGIDLLDQLLQDK